MSGFVAVVSVDGGPVDRDLVTRMTKSLAFRGPDAQSVWVGEGAGLGHAMLATKDDERAEEQPCTLDGKVWITGDIRIDARADLIAAMRQAGRDPDKQATDPELVLHAFECWGERLVERLLGDFSFVIWDARSRRLFCSRDQLGVKPLYYGVTDGKLFISNTLSCLVSHTSLGDDINDLLYGFNADLETTSYRDIRRLPGGHALGWSAPGGALSVSRYWTFEDYGELRLAHPQDYVERYRHLLTLATGDRLRAGKVGIWMSGGLDSTLVAAIAKGLLPGGDRERLTAHSCVYDRLIPDEERYYAAIAASGLGIPIHFYPRDDFGMEEDAGARPFPEPLDDHARPTYANYVNRQFALSAKVALTGVDGDGPLRGSCTGHFRQLLGAGKLVQAAGDALRLAQAKQRLGGAIWRRMPLKRGGAVPEAPSGYPEWLNPDFEARNHLRERWEEQVWESGWTGGGNRAAAYRNMTLPRWARLFELYDAGVTGIAVDSRHPLLDLRLLRFLLALPSVPWCVDKHIMRRAARGLLPKAIRSRPKTGLRGDPGRILAGPFLSSSAHMRPNAAMERFINAVRLKKVLERSDHEPYWVNVRPAILSRWLNGYTKEVR